MLIIVTIIILFAEINQGMDRRAERLVHDQLVETTCRESASQYFLITPKLLFGLRYHPLMRVLCVNNVSLFLCYLAFLVTLGMSVY